MRYFLFIFILTAYSSLFSQNKKLSKADSLRKEGNLEAAIAAYDSLYNSLPTNRNNTYDYACALALAKRKDSAFKYLFIATANDSNTQALNDPDFYFLLEDERWKLLEDTLIPRIEAKYEPYKNLELSKELWRMKIKDQAFYYHLKVADQQLGSQSPIIRAMWELKHLINEENLDRIKEIIAENGWPKRSQVGRSASGTVFLIIQHADLETQKEYLPVMKAAVEQKEASGGSLALLIDRINIREGKKQIYGSQIGRKADGTYFVMDLEDPYTVNEKREEVGLGPLEDYAKNWKIEWTPELQEDTESDQE